MGSICQKIETGFVFAKVMNDKVVERFNRKPFLSKNTEILTTKSGNLKIEDYYRENIDVKHVAVKSRKTKK